MTRLVDGECVAITGGEAYEGPVERGVIRGEPGARTLSLAGDTGDEMDFEVQLRELRPGYVEGTWRYVSESGAELGGGEVSSGQLYDSAEEGWALCLTYREDQEEGTWWFRLQPLDDEDDEDDD
jgi:hypothetical protein